MTKDVNSLNFNNIDVVKIKEELLESLNEYRKTLSYLACDVPIEVLCLEKKTIKILRRNGIFRVYDFFNCDLTKIESLSEVVIGDLTTRLNQFFPIS